LMRLCDKSKNRRLSCILHSKLIDNSDILLLFLFHHVRKLMRLN
jgi:hypothetical protein